MSNRNVSLAVVCLAASMAVFGQSNRGVGYLFQLPGSSSSGGQFFPFVETANPFTPVINTAVGPSGTFKVLATPSGNKFYLLGTSGANGLQSVDSTFTSFHSVNGLGAPPTAAVVTPDGKYLVVAADGLYIVDTTNDQIVTSPPLPLSSVPSTLCPNCGGAGIAISKDSTLAYVLTNNSFGSSVAVYNIPLRQRVNSIQSLSIFGGATSITLSPLGLLYVAVVNRLYEINPATLQVTTNGLLQLVATPGPLHFTPDGSKAFFVNTTPTIGGQALLELNVGTLSVSSWPPPPYNPGNPPPQFDDVYVAGNNRAFAFSSATNTLWDVTPSPLNVVASTLSSVFQSIGTPLAAAISNELPTARYLFLLIANGNQYYMDRIDLSTNTLSVQATAPSSTGILQTIAVPDQTAAAAASFIQFNNLQLVSAGGTSVPLIARVLDAGGVPVFNLPVTFSTDATSAAAGLILNTPTPTSNADGYVQTTVAAPPTPGTYTITLTAGTANTTFTVTVPGGTTGGGGPGGGPSQVTIVSGDGQLLAENSNTGIASPSNPLTLRVTDTSGNPISGATVAFSVTSGPGAALSSSTSTDANGYASSQFISGTVTSGLAFSISNVNAITQYGQVNFTVNTVHLNNDGSGQPQVRLIAPDASRVITAAQGTPVPNAIVATINSANFPQIGTPIPGVSITPFSPFTSTFVPGPASTGYVAPAATCQGSTLSDSTGTASCTLVAACLAGTGQELDILVGGTVFRTTLNITNGTPTKLNKISGDNQNGSAGQTLSQTLIATVTDGCGTPIPGVGVSWTILQGSAVLNSTVTTSDSQGRVSTRVTLGQTPGAVQVRVAIGTTVQATYQLTNQVVVSGLSLTGGNNQTATTGQTFPLPLTFLVHDSSGNPVSGVLVTFTVTNGSATLNPVSASTNALGTASTSVSAGLPAGNIGITATAAGFTATATLVSQSPGPSITASSFTNAASGVSGLVPCGLGTLTGNGIAPNIQGVVTPFNAFGPPPLQLQGFGMSVNGVLAPILAIANQNGIQQVNFQTPCETAPGTATVVVTVNGGNTTVTGVPILQAQPGIFTFSGGNNLTYGAVISVKDGSYVTPGNPARIGQDYYLVVTGLGQVSPPTSTDSAGVPGQNVPLTVVVGVNNAGVPVVSSQYAINEIGAYLVRFTIPANASTGPNQALAIGVIVNGQEIFGNSVLLPAVAN